MHNNQDNSLQLAIITKNVNVQPTMIKHNGFWSKNLAFIQPFSYMQMVVWLQKSFKSGWIWQTAQVKYNVSLVN